MKQYIDHGIGIKVWTDDFDEGTLQQMKNLAELPFAFKHIAVMPDTHFGFGMPIGAIIATKGEVIPNAVGVDIGCGMCVYNTGLKEVSSVKEIIGKWRKTIPVGFNWHKETQDYELKTPIQKSFCVQDEHIEKAMKQLGSLGGGNHFVELQKGDDGFIYVMIHSGSRGLGHLVASHHHETAVRENRRFLSVVPEDLAFLPWKHGSKMLRDDYIREMEMCVDYAYDNRKLMMIRALEALGVEFDEKLMINESHNFARWEYHFGTNVLVHRKGATSARPGEFGMIPGSQGANSYIVRGLGEKNSFMSCSHGAGRRLGRKQAQSTLDLSEEKEHLDNLGVVHSIRGKHDLDEAPSAYKNIEDVMANQTDLCEIVVTLQPLGVLKG